MCLVIYSKINSLTANDAFKLDVPDESIRSMTVKCLAERVSGILGLSLKDGEPDLDLICFGRTLKPEKPLAFYGIKSGTAIYVFKRKNNLERGKEDVVDKGKKPKLDQTELSRMMVALRTALINPSFRTMLDRLHEREFRENILACTPGLTKDPMALAILHDPDLLALLTDPEHSQKILDKHPCIAEAATNLAAAFHEDAVQSPTTSVSEGSYGNNLGLPSSDVYSLDDLSDDEDLGGGVDAAPPDGQHVMSPRTAQTFHHLWQQALNARPNAAGSGQGASGSGQSQPGRITAEMLMQAINSTQPSTSGISGSGSESSAPNPTSQLAPERRDWSQQLQQLRDLGITDNALSIQALEAANGDVEAAINIIFGDRFNQ